MLIEIPLGLRQALESGNCVLFVGAGLGNYATDPQGNKAPDSRSLAKDLAKAFGIITDIDDLAKIAQVVEYRTSRVELESFVKSRLSKLTTDDCLQWIPAIRWRAIYTTNYDSIIPDLYAREPSPVQICIPITSTAGITAYDARFEVPLYYLHGDLSGDSAIIITQDDYVKYNERRRMMFEQLKLHLATSCILYVGYSNNDPNWNTVQFEIADEYSPSPMPRSYRIDPFPDPINKEILEMKNIHTIGCRFDEFIEVASVLLKEVKHELAHAESLESRVPPELSATFHTNPAATIRLLSAWDYVPSAAFNDQPNTADFLRGDKPNWSLIGQRNYFERDIEAEIYDCLLDYATKPDSQASCAIILGSAGYGTTTLLMALAARLIRDGMRSVFFLKPTYRITEGDLDFVTDMLQERSFFFIDDAAEHAEDIRIMRHKFNEAGKTAMFVLGERRNEWAQSNIRLRGHTFQIEALSDGEVRRLIACLSRHGELNKLRDLSSEMQMAAIKRNYNRELLVAIREATEGRSFDAIIEDEYRGIADEFGRAVYLTACCFYQHGAWVRDSLIAEIMSVNLVTLLKRVEHTTSGVIMHECLDEDKGIYGFRCRHRIIASVVWERCGDPSEKAKLVENCISALNLNYRQDGQAFEHFIRTDWIVDSLRDFESKVRFFEVASNKDPDSPYVKQHYARMLLREGKETLALSQIDGAIKIDPGVRVLHHTRAHILSSMSSNIESEDIARKFLSQSEASYRRVLSKNSRDEYSHQGLAKLFLNWAKRASSHEERMEYVKKSEQVINEGLKCVRDRDALWIESANIQKFLGDTPSWLEHLERAVEDSPASIIARYMLGRAYNESGFYGKALLVLQPVILDYPDEYRAHIEYALALEMLGHPNKEVIAILNQSTLYGCGDVRFVATLGGLLFMDKQFLRADEIFREAQRRELENLYGVYYRPRDPADRNSYRRLRGVVKTVKAGYSILHNDEYPDFVCRSSKYGSLLLKPDMIVDFQVGFTAKGNIAELPNLISESVQKVV